MTRAGALGLATLGAAAALALGCASDAREAMHAARARYEQCVAASSERACSAEKERMLAAERAYQEAAQRAWSCDPSQPDCPTHR